MLKINEIFYSIQGEGKYTGYPMTFIRLSGCNLNCKFCDTKHQEFNLMTIEEILEKVYYYPTPYVCITGGEPLMQDLTKLLYTLKKYYLHLETNGTYPIPWDFQYVCISPKNKQVPYSNLVHADDIKILCGSTDWEDLALYYLNQCSSISLQPLSLSPEYTNKAIQYCQHHPSNTRISIQIQKLINIK